MTEISTVGSMLPPERRGTAEAPPPALAAQQRRDADRSRAFDDELRALEQEHDRLADLLIGDADHVVERVLENPAGELADALDRDPVGEGPAFQPGLHADDAQLRLDR